MESKLNRSFSAPDITVEPIRRRVFMEEFYYPSGSPCPIRRQISYDHFPQQIPGQDIQSVFPAIEQKPLPFLRSYRGDNIQFSEYPRHEGPIPNSVKYIEYPETGVSDYRLDRFNDSPMDIDMEDLQPKEKTATSTPIISEKTVAGIIKTRLGSKRLEKWEESGKGSGADLKSRFRNLTGKENKSEVVKKSSLKLPIAVTIVLALALVPVYDHYNYNRTIDIEQIRSDLTSSVINQDPQNAQIVEFLARINDVKSKHVLTFIGASGVGKTHCANILKRAFKPQQTHEIALGDFNLNNFHLHRDIPYLLLLENLRFSDIERVVLLLDALPSNKSLLILTVFNTQETDDQRDYTNHNEYFTEIPIKFKNSGYLTETVNFNSFDKSTVKAHYDFLTKDLVVSEEVFGRTVEEHDFERFGLKKFFAKLNLS